MTKKDKNIKKYTAWHYYFAYLIEYLLKDTKYSVETEVSVGTLPLEIDIIIIESRKEKNTKELQKLPILFEQLNKYTIIEFKSYQDRLKPEDFDKLRAYGLLYKLKKGVELDRDITIMTVSSTLSAKYKSNLKSNGFHLEIIEKGVYQITNLSFRCIAYALNEIEEDKRNKLLLMFASKYKKNISQLFKNDLEDSEIARFVFENVFNQEVNNMILSAASREAMKKDIAEIHEDFKKSILKELTVQERLKGLKPQERLKGLKPQERLKGLSKKERNELKKILLND